MKKILKYLLAFFIPIIIVLIILKIKDIYPLGKYTPRLYDSFHQYTSFFLAYKNFSFYSLKTGLGFNLYGTATYYLLSPLNILFIFSNIFNIDLIFTIIYLIKIGLASLFMMILLNNTTKHKSSLLFGIIYGLSGFIITYYYNIMWHDSVYMLPLVILGLNRLINKDKPLLYLITLSLTIIFNYYTGYMVCIFALLFFIFSVINLEKEKRKKAIINFIVYSLLAGLISSVVLLPAFYSLLMGKASGYLRNDYTKYSGINKNVYLFFYKLAPGTYINGNQANGPMIIYSTLFSFVLFILTIFNKKYDLKYKLSLVIFFLVFLLSFTFNLFDYAWQFFQRPVWWNNRYAFIFSFFIIYFAYQNYVNKNAIDTKNNIYYPLTIISTLALFTVSFYEAYITIGTSSTRVFIIIMFAISILFTFSYFYYYNVTVFKKYILSLVILELCLNTFFAFHNNTSHREVESLKVYNTNMTKIIDKIPNKELYRAELIDKHVYNDGLIYGYNGINYFNSVRNQNYVNFCENIVELKVDSHCSTTLNYFDPILFNLFNIKYLVGNDQNYYHVYTKYNNTYIYETDFDSSYGYLVNSNIKSLKLSNKDDKFTNLTKILNTMINENNIYYKELNLLDYDYQIDNGYYKDNHIYPNNDKNAITVTATFISKEDQLIVPKSPTSFNKNIIIKINDQSYITNGSYYLAKKGDLVSISVSYDSKKNTLNTFPFYTMNLKVLNDAINKLDTNKLVLTKNASHLIEGTVNVSNNKTLFLSLPYEKGFIIKVDGKITSYQKILDSFVAIDLEAGNHTITIDYVSQGFNMGLLLTSIGLITSSILLITKKCYNKHE